MDFRNASSIVLAGIAVSASLLMWPGQADAADPPGPTEINGQKVLTLISREPPVLRCNNNMQVAAELSNIYKVPVLIMPVSLAKPGTKAPTVWYGKDLMAEDGGINNGMVSFKQLEDVLEIEDVPKLTRPGRLIDADVKPKFEELKRQIRQVP
jgi:hypothetical protein